jgi:NTE family protein
VRLQLAFQGGGARLAVLLAAAEAIQALEAEGLIRVTRIAGTSAGAIVGAFLAADLPICRIRQALASKDGEELLAQFPFPSGSLRRLRVIERIVRGKPIWSDEPLRKWLSTLFRMLGNASGRVTRELLVVSASLADGAAINHRFIPHPSDDECRSEPRLSLVDALLESAGLPFCFRTWKSARYFDGGICENLPIDALSGGEKQFGRVIAFSFNQVWPGIPDSVVKFALSLLDLAITHSGGNGKGAHRAGLGLPAHVLRDWDVRLWEGAGISRGRRGIFEICRTGEVVGGEVCHHRQME